MYMSTISYEDFCQVVANGNRATLKAPVDFGTQTPKPAQFPCDPGQPSFDGCKQDNGNWLIKYVSDAKARHTLSEMFLQKCSEIPEIRDLNLPKYVITGIPNSPDVPVAMIAHRHCNAIVVNSKTAKGEWFRDSDGRFLEKVDIHRNAYELFQHFPDSILKGYFDSTFKRDGTSASRSKAAALTALEVIAESKWVAGSPKFTSKDPLELSSTLMGNAVNPSGVVTDWKTEAEVAALKAAKDEAGGKYKEASGLGFGAHISGSESPKKDRKAKPNRETYLVEDKIPMLQLTFPINSIRQMKFFGPKGEDFGPHCRRILVAMELYQIISVLAEALPWRSDCSFKVIDPLWDFDIRETEENENPQSFMGVKISLKQAKDFLVRACTEAKAAGVTWVGEVKLTLSDVAAKGSLESAASRGRSNNGDAEGEEQDEEQAEAPKPAPKAKGRKGGK